MPWQINLSNKHDIIWYHFDFTSCSACSNCSTEDNPPSHQSYLYVAYMLHSALMVFIWFSHIMSVTFRHPPLGFCCEQRAFRLCTGQSSKLLFVFLRWENRNNTMQPTSTNGQNLIPCWSQPDPTGFWTEFSTAFQSSLQKYTWHDVTT